MHHLKVVDDCPLILALLPTPGAVGHAIEVVKGVQVMYGHQSHNLWGLRWGYNSEELKAFWLRPQSIVSLSQLIWPLPYFLDFVNG